MEQIEAINVAESFLIGLGMTDIGRITPVGRGEAWWVLSPARISGVNYDAPFVVVEDIGACHIANKPWGVWFDTMEPLQVVHSEQEE